MSSIRILLVDDHPVVRGGIRGLLEKTGDIEIVGEAANGGDALELVKSAAPDVVLLDMELPDVEGSQVAHQIREQYPGVKILALSAHDDAVYIKSLLESGAAGYLMKDEAPEFILEAVQGVARGEQGWVSRRISARIVSWMQPDADGGGALSPREEEVLRRVAQGKTNQAIAVELGISEKTVEKYLGAIFTKLKVASRVEAAVYAVRSGLV